MWLILAGAQAFHCLRFKCTWLTSALDCSVLRSLQGSECEGTLCDFIFHLPNRLCHMSTFIIFALKVQMDQFAAKGGNIRSSLICGFSSILRVCADQLHQLSDGLQKFQCFVYNFFLMWMYYVLTTLIGVITILTLYKPQRCVLVIAIAARCSLFLAALRKLAGNRHFSTSYCAFWKTVY